MLERTMTNHRTKMQSFEFCLKFTFILVYAVHVTTAPLQVVRCRALNRWENAQFFFSYLAM